ncbi:hypothetical protein JYU34_004381 [Plutella xylostella]|uniref:FLYWCH-type domain-containing protein n=1 Tax=Plutella xylostella TaxID=51655 RepID=A0ABQ7QXV5_PLUXY|nr:hypothetical protein JYU34_004381 [Plutella xylostella]
MTSSTGARLMRLRGYSYGRHSVCSNKVRWLCSESRNTKCHSTVVTIGRQIISPGEKHTHPPNST